MHYMEMRRLGRLAVLPKPTPAERFWAKVDKSTGCWLWTGAIDANGYGYFGMDGVVIRAHQASYRLNVGAVPDGLELDHLCRTPRCVRPDHLEPVTHRENLLRGAAPVGVNARKTHCIRGHEFTAINTYVDPRGRRQCRICIQVRERQRSDR